jgi:hypothetical protein
MDEQARVVRWLTIIFRTNYERIVKKTYVSFVWKLWPGNDQQIKTWYKGLR